MRLEAFEFKDKIDDDPFIITTKKAFDDFLRKVLSENFIVIDVEGNEENLLGVGFGFYSKETFYIPFRNIETELSKEFVFEILKSVFKKEPKTFLGHNIKFDLKVLAWQGLNLIDRKQEFHDTQIIGWLLDSRRCRVKGGLSLDGLCKEYGVRGKLEEFQRINIYDAKEIANYCRADCLATLELFEKLEEELSKDKKLKTIYEIERRLIPYITLMELRGVVIDVKKIEEIEKTLDSLTEKLYKDLIKLTGKRTINFRSSKQILAIIPEDIKDQLPKGKTQILTRNDYLLPFSSNPTIKALLEYRSLDRIKSTFGLTLVKKAQEVKENKALIRAEFRQDGTVSGRFKSRNPNLQNIPKRNEEISRVIRGAFVPREGFKYLIADASQIELRSLALISKDPKLLEVFNSDGDLHQTTADLLGISRYEGKTINFSIVYGISPESLASTLEIPKEEAKDLIEEFFEEYKNVKRLRDYIRFRLKSKKEIRTYFGRKRLFDFDFLTEDIFRQAFNFTCQGTAADIVKAAMVACYENKNLNAIPVLQVHDEIVLEVVENKVLEIVEILKETLEKAPLIKDLPVKILFDIEVANNWV